MLGLEELLEQSDFVSVNCDLNPTSLRLMNARTFARIKTGAVLINTARGPIVDEDRPGRRAAHGKARRRGARRVRARAAAGGRPLRSMDNVLLAPHNSNSSPSAWERVHRSTLAQLAEALGAAYP